MWHIYWICGICHAANVQTEGMVLIFIYYYVRVRTHRTARALRAAHSIALICAHSNKKCSMSQMRTHSLEGRKRDECILEPENIVCQRTHRLEGRKKDMQHICGTL